MKLLCINPGASISTIDVYTGLTAALHDAGHEIVQYSLDARIENSGAFLKFLRRRAKRNGNDTFRPTGTDIFYLASQGVLERALYHKVDGVLIFSGMYLHPNALILMARAGVKTAIIGTESPYDDVPFSRLLPFIDVAFTNERTSVERLRAVNPEVHYLPHAYSPAVHNPDVYSPGFVPAHDVVVVGTLFQERIELLSAVDWSGIDFGLYGEHGLVGSRSKLRQHIKGRHVENTYAAALYKRAKIGLNLHRTSMGFGKNAPRILHAESLNPRAYELAACGVFHLSDDRAEVGEMFGPLVRTFETPETLEMLIRHYLVNEDDRQRKAAQLPEAVHEHTFAARAATVTEHLERVWFPDREPARELTRV